MKGYQFDHREAPVAEISWSLHRCSRSPPSFKENDKSQAGEMECTNSQKYLVKLESAQQHMRGHQKNTVNCQKGLSVTKI